MVEIGLVGGLAFGALAMALLLLAGLRRLRRRLGAARSGSGRIEPGPIEPGSAEPGPAEPGPGPTRRLELRLEALEARLAETLAEGSPEERLRDMAGSLVGLIRDKNATLETALAGLDQLRARLRALERIGDLGEARALFEDLGGRIEALGAEMAARAAEAGERLAQLRARVEAEETPRLALAEQLARLYDAREAGLAAVLDRLGPIETGLARIEAARDAEAAREEAAQAERARIEARMEGRLAELDHAREAGARALATLADEIEAEVRSGREAALEAHVGPVREIAERLSGLRAALDALDARLGRFEDRMGALEAPAENPFAALGARLADLAERRDAGLEAVLARLGPLEAALNETARDLAERRAAEAAAAARLHALEHPGLDPFAAIRAELTDLALQKEATVETVVGLIAPLESRLAEALEQAERAWAGLDDRIGARLAAELETGLEASLAAGLAPVEARLAGIEARGAERSAEESARETAREAAEAAAAALAEERAALFANRLALLEASLPGPAGAYKAEESEPGEPAPGDSPAAEAPSDPKARRAADLAAIRNMRRIVSLHRE